MISTNAASSIFASLRPLGHAARAGGSPVAPVLEAEILDDQPGERRARGQGVEITIHPRFTVRQVRSVPPPSIFYGPDAQTRVLDLDRPGTLLHTVA